MNNNGNAHNKLQPGDPGWVDFTPKPDDFTPTAEWPEDHRHHGTAVPRCQAWSPRKGRQCLAIAKSGGDKCKTHGGKSLSGIASPVAKDLRYSKAMPRGLLDKYLEFSQDDDLLVMRHEIAVITTYLDSLIAEIDTDTVSPDRWKMAQKAYNELVEALSLGDGQALSKAVFTLGDILNAGADTTKKWENVLNVMESRKRMISAEEKRLSDASMLITVSSAMILIDALLQSVRRNVSDTSALQAIQSDFNRLTSGG